MLIYRSFHSSRAGFTLIEMVVSLAVASIVMVAMGSVVVVSSRALPDGSDRAMRAGQVGRMMDRFNEDLETATAVQAIANGFVLTLPDYDNDSVVDFAAYQFDPDLGIIRWADESGVWVELLGGVHRWEFTTTMDGTKLVRTSCLIQLNDGVTEPIEWVAEALNRPEVN